MMKDDKKAGYTDQDIPALQASDLIKNGSMIRCPNCNEEVLNAQPKCPFCSHTRAVKRDR